MPAPCDIIIILSSGHHNCVIIGNPAGQKSTVTQCKGSSTCNKEDENFLLLKTWHNLCSELCFCIIMTAQQHNGVGKRWWTPGHMEISH